MKVQRTLRTLAVASLALVLPSCAPDDGSGRTGEDDAGVEEIRGRLADDTRDVDELAEQVGDTQLTAVEAEPHGVYLTTGDVPVYLFTADARGDSSACYDTCAEAWPPVTGKVDIAPPLDMALVGTIERRDGSRQATYGGWPLYTFARDTDVAEPTGQEVESFGGEWYLVGMRGAPVDTNEESGA